MSISPLFCRPRSLPGLRVLARVFSHQAGVLRRVLADEVTDVSDAEDFFRYTSGRWLWNEAAHLEERYKRFNIAELKQAAAEAAGAQSCSQITKLAEGGFNKVFKLVMDNDSVVVARIPNPDVGRVDRMIASEVATMEFVRFYGSFRDETMLTRTRQRKSSASLFRRSCLGAETNRMLSSPLTFSWSMQEARSLATYGKILKLARRWLSSTKQSRLRGSSLRSHSHGK
jgi:hypothetical protein